MKTSKLLDIARKHREGDRPEQALDVFNTVIFQAQKEKDHAQVVEAFGDRAILYRHLFESTGDVIYAVLARKDAETMLELVKMLGIVEKLPTAYYLLGQAALLFQEYKEAENYFFKALRYFKGSSAEKGSWRYHWAKALYLLGEKKKALFAFAKAIDEIKKSSGKTDSFLQNVYLSGAYSNFAYVLIKDDPEEAMKYYGLAKELIDSDKRLVIRKKQFKNLQQTFRKMELL